MCDCTQTAGRYILHLADCASIPGMPVARKPVAAPKRSPRKPRPTAPKAAAPTTPKRKALTVAERRALIGAPGTVPVAAPKAPRKPRRPRVFKGTREEWLEAFTVELRPHLEAAGAKLPKRVKCSCGFASSGIRSNTIGECWVPEASGAGVPELFIVPRLDDSLEVAAVLLHELIHAAGIRGHGAEFKAPAVKLGLVGPMTATTAGPEAIKLLSGIIRKLGSYPHATLDPRLAIGKLPVPAPKPGEPVPVGPDGEPLPPVLLPGGWTSARPTQGTRMLKVACADCGCVVRMTRTWIERVGLPTCGCGSAMQEG